MAALGDLVREREREEEDEEEEEVLAGEEEEVLRPTATPASAGGRDIVARFSCLN